ncbi:MAG: type II toxin-antitoxin system VapC family toxin [Cyanophyceae cyanobacterium]
MTKRRFFDTNILIDFLNGELTVRDLVNHAMETQTAYYSPITWIELLSYPQLTDTQAQAIRDFLHQQQIVELSEEILDRTAAIRRATRVKLPDALIAASAIESNCTLVTRNVKDFERIDTLEIENPYDD